jgi:CheY-like chemotaxis protein
VPLGSAPASRAEPLPAVLPLAGTLAGRVVAVVENDQAVQAAMQALLQGWGCTLAVAHSAAGVMARLDTLGRPPDVIVADYHLDGGASGTAAIETLRQRYGSDVPALVISGNHSEALRGELRALGHGFLAKPVAPAKLRAMLSYTLNDTLHGQRDARRPAPCHRPVTTGGAGT